MKFKHNNEFIEISRYGWSNENQESAIEHAKLIASAGYKRVYLV